MSGGLLAPKIGAFTKKFSGIVQSIETNVHISTFFDPQDYESISLDICGAKQFLSIWDTGGTSTVISKKVVKECKLKPFSMAIAQSTHGKKWTQAYLISLFLPNNVVLGYLAVIEGKMDTCDVLIGMDIISKGDFAITRKDGNTLFSFRMPSMEAIDFYKPARDEDNGLFYWQ